MNARPPEPAAASAPPSGARATRLDISQCDQEPVHLANAIQPHAALLVVDEPGLTIVQASANTGSFLGMDVHALTGQPLTTLLGAEHTAALQDQLARKNLTGVLAHLLTVQGLPHRDVRLHLFGNRIDGRLLLEFECTDSTEPAPVSTILCGLYDAMQRLQQAASLSEFLEVAAGQIRDFSGFDRVMIYRFDPDGSGVVLAEAKADPLEAYLSLHYPASDIPAPARRLFALSPLRHLPDVDYIPVPLLPWPTRPAMAQPIDLSFAFSRSVSLLYRDYLRNMGVKATMVMPLLKNGALWGLISCMHHAAPKHLPYEQRIPLEFLAGMVSQQLMSREALDQAAYRIQLDTLLEQLTHQLMQGDSLHETLTAGPANLLSVVDASGVALIAEGRTTLLGTTPAPEAMQQLVNWLGRQAGPIFATHQLAHDLPMAESFRVTASGLLSIRLSRTSSDWLIWFRPEVITEVAWAGNPEKPVEIDSEEPEIRLRPRSSFAIWKLSVSGESRPWLECEIEFATRLRRAIFEMIVERARLLAQINRDLERSNLELDSFAYAASHDMKEPLRGIHNTAEFLLIEENERLSATGQRRLQTIIRLTGRMASLLESLLQYSRIGRNELDLHTYPLHELVLQTVDVLRNAFPDEPLDIRIQPELPNVRCDQVWVSTIFQNLITNAVKYNTHAVKRIDIGCDASSDPPMIFVRDNGIGVAPERQGDIFQLFRRLHGPDAFGGGVGAGLTIVRRAIERHGGTIRVKSTPNQGSTFFFTLAPEQPS